MKEFQDFIFDPNACRQELNELKQHLDNKIELNERKDVLPFFRRQKNLAAFIGSYFPYISSFDKLAYEYDIFGDFKADLAVGDAEAGWYGFIEFEGASHSSIFEKKGNKVTPEWSTHFEHGFSQVVDWFWKLSALEYTREFVTRFGSEFTGYGGMAIANVNCITQ